MLHVRDRQERHDQTARENDQTVLRKRASISVIRKYWPELLLLSIFLSVISWQIFVPPFVGLADNGDFPKVTGRLSIGPRGPYEKFVYFTSDYIRSPRFRWKGDVIFSELIPAWFATSVVRNVTRSNRFDIRCLGATHLALLLIAYALLLSLLRTSRLSVRVGVSGLALIIFTDVCYVSYLNSFYSDTTALLGLLLSTVCALHIFRNVQPNWKMWAVFVSAAFLFITSKAQHGIWGIFPVAFVVFAAMRSPRRIRPRYAAGVCLFLLATSITEFRITPSEYKAQALFNLVFYKIARESQTPAEDLRALHMDSSATRYIGLTAYSPTSPAGGGDWVSRFYKTVGYKSVARFYISHPTRTLVILRNDLYSASQLRPGFGNFRRADGVPPRTEARHFAAWSDFRSRLFKLFPLHILFWYLAVSAACLAIVFRSSEPFWRGTAIICLALAGLGVLEYAFASLADAIETDRHLFIFQALTDLTVCFAAAGLLNLPGMMKALGAREPGQFIC